MDGLKSCVEVMKGLNERNGKIIRRWFGHTERMESSGIAKRVYDGKYLESRAWGRPRKRWINSVDG